MSADIGRQVRANKNGTEFSFIEKKGEDGNTRWKIDWHKGTPFKIGRHEVDLVGLE